MKKILAIDYGEKNLGLAFTESNLAEPVGVISSAKPLLKLLAHINKYNPDLILLGLPEGPLTEKVLTFKNTLTQKTQKKVILHPETLSTHEALQKLKEIGASYKKIQEDHKYAAALILQDYLDTNQ